MTKMAKRDYEHKIALESKQNPKSFWKFINSKIKTRNGVNRVEKSDGMIVYDDKDQVEVLNEYFSSVFTRI